MTGAPGRDDRRAPMTGAPDRDDRRAATTFATTRRLAIGGRHLAYHDSDSGAPLLALHGHFSRGRTWARLAERVAPQWRVVAPDQRGHGLSSPAEDYDREGYVADAARVVEALDLAPAVVLGHSLGGVNAYQLAARRPELVRAVIVEDAPADVPPHPDAGSWTAPRRFPSLQALTEQVDDPYLLESAFEDDDGWGFRFDPDQLDRSRHLLTGDHWADWLAGEHPALLLHGLESTRLVTAHAREMARRRPATRLVEFPGAGHTIHDDDPEGFALAVTSFLAELQ
jgi:esterase